MLVAGVAGLVAGAMSMAAGEYVSVSSQSDTEQADLARETAELKANPAAEREELAGIYIKRGLDPELAHRVALELMAHDALEAHARDELGISEVMTARPVQAALTSSATFSAGAALPLLVAAVAPLAWIVPAVFVASLHLSRRCWAQLARARAAPMSGARPGVCCSGGRLPWR